MSKKTAEYGNESISSLKGADRVRKCPAVIFGSDGLEGCQHAVFEILSNSIDEARGGHGREIIVTRFLDKSIEVEDFGRGIPVDFNPRENRFNWELVYCELYAGGKYSRSESDNYEFSLGLNGLGACATQYSSEYMDVTSWYDGFKYSLHFEKGNMTEGGFIKEPSARKKTGTIQRWRPDLEVFTDINIPVEYFTSVLKRQAVVNRGVRFVFKDETENGKFDTQTFEYADGITDYVMEITGVSDRDPSEQDAESASRVLVPPLYFEAERRGRDRADKPEYKVRMEVCFTFTNSSSFIEYYHNSSWLEHGGAPDKATRSAFVSAIDGAIKQAGKYQKNEAKITWQDVADSLTIVISSFSTQASYENQTKKAVTNKFIQEAMTEFLRDKLSIYFIENPGEAQKICDQMLINKRSRETAENTRLNLKKKLAGGVDINNRVNKFVNCRSKDIDKRELYIVEGDSALGACKLGRDAEFQAIMPVRGKTLNCLKSDYAKIFKNEIITNLIRVLGCGVEIKGHKKDVEAFDLTALKWNKIIICTDADYDGFHIRTIILAMFYRLMPTLIQKGYIYIAESPLFEITHRDKTAFAWSEREKEAVLEKWGRPKGATVNRSKGLGENEPDMMWLTTMSPETRRLVQVLPEDAAETARVFDMLLGEDLPARKSFIADYGHEYLEMADIS